MTTFGTPRNFCNKPRTSSGVDLTTDVTFLFPSPEKNDIVIIFFKYYYFVFVIDVGRNYYVSVQELLNRRISRELVLISVKIWMFSVLEGSKPQT